MTGWGERLWRALDDVPGEVALWLLASAFALAMLAV